MSLQKWREEREVAKNTILQLRDTLRREDRDFNSEERESWSKANKDFDRLGGLIESYERGEAVESGRLDRDGEPKPGMEDRYSERTERRLRREGRDREATAGELAVQAWVHAQAGQPISERHERACRKVGISATQKYLDIDLGAGREQRAQSVGTADKGGYSVPVSLMNSLEIALKIWSPVREHATILRTPGGEDLDVVSTNDTTNLATLLAENTTVGAAVDVTLAKATLEAYKFQSGLILCSSELLQDNAINLADQLGTLIGQRLGRGQDAYLTTGTGSSQPQGFVVGSTLGKTAAGVAAVTSDELMDLFHSLDPAYRASPKCMWAFNDSTAVYIRKLKNGASDYLWQPGLQAGQPDMLLGKPVMLAPSMANMATGAKTIVIGDFSRFYVREAGPVRLYRLEERYRDIDQTAFIAFSRIDSRVINAGTGPLRHLIQA